VVINGFLNTQCALSCKTNSSLDKEFPSKILGLVHKNDPSRKYSKSALSPYVKVPKLNLNCLDKKDKRRIREKRQRAKRNLSHLMSTIDLTSDLGQTLVKRHSTLMRLEEQAKLKLSQQYEPFCSTNIKLMCNNDFQSYKLKDNFAHKLQPTQQRAKPKFYSWIQKHELCSKGLIELSKRKNIPLHFLKLSQFCYVQIEQIVCETFRNSLDMEHSITL